MYRSSDLVVWALCMNFIWYYRMESQVESGESDSEKSSESEEETQEEDCALESYITKAAVEENYELMERVYTPDPSPLVLSDLRLAHPEAFSPASESALASALSDLSLPFPLSDFQTFSVNCLLNQHDLLCVVPTGERCKIHLILSHLQNKFCYK